MVQAIRAVAAMLAATAAMYMSMTDASAQQRRGEATRPPAQDQLAKPPAQPALPQMKIEKWWFQWTVVEMGDTTLAMIKTNDSDFVLIKSGFDSLRLTGAEAELIGAALGETDAVYARLRGPGSSEETRAVGEYTVRFSKDEKSGFMVSIAEGGLFGESVLLWREQALAVAPHMQKARVMLAVVSQRVRP
ncbi:MAG: hypothetical protein GX537_08760 [Actinobacteria bacterium]|nr:hypothetical protein [Actinomycetota bacterium]